MYIVERHDRSYWSRNGARRRDRKCSRLSRAPGTNVSTAFDAIEQLRPQFFRSRGATSILLRAQTQTSVYLDNMRLGGLEALHDVPITGIESIRYLSAGEATNRWGTNRTGDAILLVSR